MNKSRIILTISKVVIITLLILAILGYIMSLFSPKENISIVSDDIFIKKVQQFFEWRDIKWISINQEKQTIILDSNSGSIACNETCLWVDGIYIKERLLQYDVITVSNRDIDGIYIFEILNHVRWYDILKYYPNWLDKTTILSNSNEKLIRIFNKNWALFSLISS